jgi:hypothetical protein
VTNTRYHADWLKREPVMRSKDPIQLLPVFSTVGEARAPVPVAQRDPAIAIFGLAATRQRGYKKLSSLSGLLNDLGIKEIWDIGSAFDVPAELSGIPVRRHGTLAAADLASQLSQARFGYLSHNSFSLAKSSIFAGYCAQGTIPVIAQSFSGEVDGLKDGVHLLSQETVKTTQTSGLQRCSTAAWDWYSGHRLHTHAATYARWLDQQESKLPEQQR